MDTTTNLALLDEPWFVVEVPTDFTSTSVIKRTRLTPRETHTLVFQSGTYLVRMVTDLRGEYLAVAELDVIFTTRIAPAYGWTWPFGRRTTHPGTPTIVTASWKPRELAHGAPAMRADAHTVTGTFRRIA